MWELKNITPSVKQHQIFLHKIGWEISGFTPTVANSIFGEHMLQDEAERISCYMIDVDTRMQEACWLGQ